jgi:protein phosphatase
MLRDFHGLRIIGDVHGNYDALQELASEAVKKSYFILSLGDLVDYGNQVVPTLQLMCDLYETGKGAFIRSNHDDKFHLWFHGRPVKMNDNFQNTVDQVYGHNDLQERFIALYNKSKPWIRYKNFIFVHGGFHPIMLEVDSFDHPFISKKFADKIRTIAYYGETNGEYNDAGFPVRTYEWINSIPKGIRVVVGHSVRSNISPFFDMDAIFLDTGSSKGGVLSAMDIDFTKSNYETFKSI